MREPAPGAECVKVPLERRLVNFFHERVGEVFSGEELAGILQVSRTAVWKHVKNLRAQGYQIESCPSRGYRFHGSPDTMVCHELSSDLGTKRIGLHVTCVREIESTNLLAYRLAENGAEDGSVVVAEAQTGGKGRLGRRWESPDGVNLYCSVILRPSIPPVRASHLTFLSAVAAVRAIKSTTNLYPRIKWPNDILVNGYKVAGLLNEMSAEIDTIHFIILGIGVNINMRKDQFPEDLRHPASSLMLESGGPISRVGFARALMAALDELYDDYLNNGFGSIRDEWLSCSMVHGHRVRIAASGDVQEGVVSGIDNDGALLVMRDDGILVRVLSGDVTVLK